MRRAEGFGCCPADAAFTACACGAVWLKAASVAASLEDARLSAITALKALLTAAHKHRLAGSASSSASSSAGGAVTSAAVQGALGTLGDALGDVAARAQQGSSRVEVAAAEAAAIDPVAAHLANAAEAAYILLLLAQEWGAAAGAADDEAAATSACAGVLQAAG